VKRAALGSVLLALGILIAGPAPQALAHADLILSSPDDGARLAEVPAQVELTFSEDLLPETVVVSVEDSTGLVIRVLEYQVDGADVIVTWPPGLSGSDYTVNYRVVSQDGHPVSGSLAFTVDGAPVATAPSASPASVDPEAASAVDAVESATTGSAAPMAAIAAGLGVGIAVGFLFLVTRRRGRSAASDAQGAPEAPGPDPAP
jgi:methionine-rich copper-binding protein CopC